MAESTVRQFGQDHGLIHEMIVTGRKAGATEEFYSMLAHDEGLFRQAVQFVLSGGKIEEVAARPAKAAKQLGLIDGLIKEGGYKKLDSWIGDQNAPAYSQLDSDPEVEYLDLGCCESSEVAAQRMQDRGYRPATDPEALRHCNKHPELPVSGNPIVVLGSVWRFRRGGRYVLILFRGSGERLVDLYWWGFDWPALFRFAAVKVSS